jgi:hypothetical protein
MSIPKWSPSRRTDPRHFQGSSSAGPSANPEAEREAFHRIGYTIGGMMVFPAERAGGKMTINGARGFHPKIKDRFDLTLECIRRHYLGEPSPLGCTLARYANFFTVRRCSNCRSRTRWPAASGG